MGPQGKLTGNVANIRSMLVEGHVVGDISVERLALRGGAFVYGDITCKSISVEPSVMISGRVNIHPLAPKPIKPDGSVSSTSTDSQVGVYIYVQCGEAKDVLYRRNWRRTRQYKERRESFTSQGLQKHQSN